tara:strand:+ start:752 stop:2104 length:1353 start_codon:yes stop_codon:yes gene_type:complete
LKKLKQNKIDKKSLAVDADNLLNDLFFKCRSITGNGLRETLDILRDFTDFNLHEIPSGEGHYDWKIPQEWNINQAYIKDSKGNTLIDFDDSNLHVINYSEPIDKKLSFDELKDNLHTLPDLPDAIPYRTAYYNKKWGFCLTHNQLKKFDKNDTYRVFIDSSFSDGSLTLGDLVLSGESNKTFLITTYPCHPSLGNDNLSGIVLWTLLLRELKKRNLKNSYRFVIHPETIGAIAYLSKNENEMLKIDSGYVISTVAGPGPIGFKKTFSENSLVDNATRLTLKENKINYIEYDFDADAGSDERQYSSPFFNIPMGTICKDKYFEYEYYHTSLDNLDFISSMDLVETLSVYLNAIDKLEKNNTYISLNPKCEPMLGKRDLYPKIGGQLKQSAGDQDKNFFDWDTRLKAINWLMYYSNGKKSLIDIALITNIDFEVLYDNAEILTDKKLLRRIN